MAKTAAERREALRKRAQQSINDRDKKGLGASTVLDLSKVENLNLYKPKSGRDTNLIDIIPFLITQEWYADLRTPSGRPTGLEIGLPDYKLEVPVHKRIGVNSDLSFLCLNRAFGKRCILCEELAAEYDKPESEQSENIIRALSSSWRCYYNIYDYDEPDKGYQLWSDASTYNFEKNFLDEAIEGDDYITFSDLENGKSIQFKGKEKSLGKNTFIEAHSVEYKDRDPYDEGVFNEVLSLDSMLIIPTPDEVSKAHLGIEDGEEITSNHSQDDSPPDTNEHTRQRQRPQPKKEQQNAHDREEAAVRGDEVIPENACPSGGRFGTDCNELQECQECSDEIFKACADAKDKGEKKEPDPPPERTRTRRNTPKEGTTQKSASHSRSRRGK